MRPKQATGRRWTGGRAPWAGTAVAALAVVAITGGGVGYAAVAAAPAERPIEAPGAANVPANATFDYTGEFANVPSAPQGTPAITGKSAMVVTTRSTTTSVSLAGVDANAVYIADVHDSACFLGEGGNRFLFDPAGVKTPPNAIWMYPIKINAAGKGTATTTSKSPANIRAKSIVVHLLRAAGDDKDNANPPKVACADLIRVTS